MLASRTVRPASAPTRRRQAFRRWIRFNLVGAVGIALQLILLVALKGGLHLGYRSATAMAVELTVIHNFAWHERYTWPDRPRSSWRRSFARLIRFNLTNGGISLFGNLAVMEIAVRLGHISYMLANTIAICVCSLLNFFISDTYVFGGNDEATN